MLASFLRKLPDIVDAVLGGAVTETTHRVMASVFDGNLQPLCDIIHDEDAKEFVRSRMIEAIALLTLRGDVSRAWSEQFLRECYDRLRPQDCCYVWSGWQQSVAWLGLSSLKPLVERAFAQGFIDKTWCSYADFAGDLQYTLDNPDAPPYRAEDDLTLFDDTILELSTWAAFDPKPAHHDRLFGLSVNRPASNPLRGVGRNDPCPCGSEEIQEVLPERGSRELNGPQFFTAGISSGGGCCWPSLYIANALSSASRSASAAATLQRKCAVWTTSTLTAAPTGIRRFAASSIWIAPL